MPIDRKSKTSLIRRIVEMRKVEHDATLSREERLKARQTADFDEIMLKKLQGNPDSAAEARYEREYGTKRTQ